MRIVRESRRAFLGRAAGVIAVAAWWRSAQRLASAEGDALLETPSDDEGPFYREGAPERGDLRVAGSKNPPMTISGTVRAEDGALLPGVVLDVWHADFRGLYDGDSPDFRHRGKVRTDAQGRWRLSTNLPGRYGLRGAQRARHVHVKCSGAGLYDLTTQMYFGVRPGLDVDAELCPKMTWSGRGAERAGTGTWDVVLSRKSS